MCALRWLPSSLFTHSENQEKEGKLVDPLDWNPFCYKSLWFTHRPLVFSFLLQKSQKTLKSPSFCRSAVTEDPQLPASHSATWAWACEGARETRGSSSESAAHLIIFRWICASPASWRAWEDCVPVCGCLCLCASAHDFFWSLWIQMKYFMDQWTY